MNHLTANLQETAAQLARYLDDQLRAGHLIPAQNSPQDPAQTVATAAQVLAEVRDNAQALALLLTRAEAAVLAVRRKATSA